MASICATSNAVKLDVCVLGWLQGLEKPQVPLHLQVSSVSPKALQLVEAAGGSVERVYYTPLGLKALLKVTAQPVRLSFMWHGTPVCVCISGTPVVTVSPTTGVRHKSHGSCAQTCGTALQWRSVRPRTRWQSC
jgi:hypothetical protein